jgi:aldehyde dehydrogenase (NAD+)
MTVKEIFETMEYGAAPESAAEALAWLVDQGDRFGHFINGSFTAPGAVFDSVNPATGEVLASITQATQENVDAAIQAARRAQGKWERLGGAGRARYLYAIARLMQKNARLLAVLETMDNGKPIREARDVDIPLAQRHFYFHAGMAQIMDDEMPDREAQGVCGQIVPWNFPLLMLAWKIAPALAAGNTVVLKPAEYTSLTALCFADICRQAGLPKGVLNIVTGDGAVGEMITTHAGVDKIAFTGSTEVGRAIRNVTAGSGKALTLELGGKSPYIVFDDADIDSAVEGLVDAIWFNQGQVCCAGSRLLLHAPIAEKFENKLRARMKNLRVGDPLDKSIDVGAIVHPVQQARIAELVATAPADTIYQPCEAPSNGCFYPPTLISRLHPCDALMQEEIFGPVLVSTTFRTPSEAVELANNTRYGLAATIWSENINLALDIAPKLACGVVWINGTNMFDAAAGFGGVKESGFGREGGWEGMTAYTRPKKKAAALKRLVPATGDGGVIAEGMDRTAKLYIGGKQVRPDGGYSQAVFAKNGKFVSHAPIANRKDIRNAVEAARSAKSWATSSAHLRSQILYYIGENLDARTEEFAHRINLLTGRRDGKKEVSASVDALFQFAAWADKFDGQTRAVPLRGVALAMREPVGVIGAFCDDAQPLLGLVTVMAAALSMGNRAVLVASEPFPLVATDFYQVLETSDVPAGVVNILAGVHGELAGQMASHMDIDAVWSFSSSDISAEIERGSVTNLKRTWVNNAKAADYSAANAKQFLDAATEVKTVWIPYGV